MLTIYICTRQLSPRCRLDIDREREIYITEQLHLFYNSQCADKRVCLNKFAFAFASVYRIIHCTHCAVGPAEFSCIWLRTLAATLYHDVITKRIAQAFTLGRRYSCRKIREFAILRLALPRDRGRGDRK